MPLPNQQDFLRQYNYSEDAIEKCGISWEELNEIYELHLSRIDSLEATAKYITDLLRRLPEVHSLRFRIKDAEHLVEKIIRKRLADSTRDINKSNYEHEITDLIGIRALHLFKQDWEAIHSFLTNEFETKEKPKAYVREGDTQEIYSAQNCDVEVHRSGYRSVHYLISSQPSKKLCVAEVQVRTLFEEGWSEIDHRLRYPYDTENILLSQLLALLNRLAGSADETGSYVSLLQEHLSVQEGDQQRTMESVQKLEQELNHVISELKVTGGQKEELEQKVSALSAQVKESQVSTSNGLMMFGHLSVLREAGLEPTTFEKTISLINQMRG